MKISLKIPTTRERTQTHKVKKREKKKASQLLGVTQRERNVQVSAHKKCSI